MLFLGRQAYGQTKERYLIFIFNHESESGGYVHFTDNHIWIIPYDSIRRDIDENMLKPLFISKMQLEVLQNPNDMSGMWPVYISDRCEPLVKFVFKNRRKIQEILQRGGRYIQHNARIMVRFLEYDR